MSPWRSNTLQVELAPDQVNLVHTQRRLTLRGVRTTVRNERLPAVACGNDAAVWRGAVQALQAALPDHAGHPTHGYVTLSSRLVHYALVPWSDALSDAAEEAAFARHVFERVHGEAAAQWELRVSADRIGAPTLASAVDARMLNAVRAAFADARVRLDSIQPRLMAVYNDYRRRLQGRHAWLALLEPGCLCLALLQQGRWVRVRSLRIGSGWRVELALLLALIIIVLRKVVDDAISLVIIISLFLVGTAIAAGSAGAAVGSAFRVAIDGKATCEVGATTV